MVIKCRNTPSHLGERAKQIFWSAASSEMTVLAQRYIYNEYNLPQGSYRNFWIIRNAKVYFWHERSIIHLGDIAMKISVVFDWNSRSFRPKFNPGSNMMGYFTERNVTTNTTQYDQCILMAIYPRYLHAYQRSCPAVLRHSNHLSHAKCFICVNAPLIKSNSG